MTSEKMRDISQRFDASAPMVWRRAIKFGDGETVPGEPVPDVIRSRPYVLREHWNRHDIELSPDDDVGKNRKRSRANGG